MPSWGTAQFITALVSTALYSTKNLIIHRMFVSLVASGPGVCARQLGRNCSEQQNWGLNVIHRGRDSTVPAGRNPGWNLLELCRDQWECEAAPMPPNRVCRWHLMKALRRFSAKINCPRGCLPSPPWANSSRKLGGGGWDGFVEVVTGGAKNQARQNQYRAVWWGAHVEREDWIPKNNSRGLLRVHVPSSEVVKCQKNYVEINPGKCIWREQHNFTRVSLDCHGMWVSSVERSALRNSKLDSKTVREAEKSKT